MATEKSEGGREAVSVPVEIGRAHDLVEEGQREKGGEQREEDPEDPFEARGARLHGRRRNPA
jgi:hypothetical protein